MVRKTPRCLTSRRTTPCSTPHYFSLCTRFMKPIFVGRPDGNEIGFWFFIFLLGPQPHSDPPEGTSVPPHRPHTSHLTRARPNFRFGPKAGNPGHDALIPANMRNSLMYYADAKCKVFPWRSPYYAMMINASAPAIIPVWAHWQWHNNDCSGVTQLRLCRMVADSIMHQYPSLQQGRTA